MAVAYTIPDAGLLLADDTESTIENGDWTEEANDDDNLILAARKRSYETFPKPSSNDMQPLGDVRALVQALGSHTDNLGARTLQLDKRAHMNDAFQTITELLKANADTLDTLTGHVDTLTGDVKIMKSEINMISDMQKTNADRQATLTGNVEIMKSEIMAKLDEFKPMLAMQKVNEEKLDDLTKDVERLGLYSSCLEYMNDGYTTSGKFRISLPNTNEQVNVYCDQNTDGGGWLVFQRRQDGSVDFNRDWVDYKVGFGETSGEFWLGNDYLHSLTRDKQELRVDLMNFEGNTAYARYSTFTVASESEKYALTVTGYSGTAGDSLEYHNGNNFSTKDRDNDKCSCFCAMARMSAWWYNRCNYSNLNGIYYNNATINPTGITWNVWKPSESLMTTEMKIRQMQ